MPWFWKRRIIEEELRYEEDPRPSVKHKGHGGSRGGNHDHALVQTDHGKHRQAYSHKQQATQKAQSSKGHKGSLSISHNHVTFSSRKHQKSASTSVTRRNGKLCLERRRGKGDGKTRAKAEELFPFSKKKHRSKKQAECCRSCRHSSQYAHKDMVLHSYARASDRYYGEYDNDHGSAGSYRSSNSFVGSYCSGNSFAGSYRSDCRSVASYRGYKRNEIEYSDDGHFDEYQYDTCIPTPGPKVTPVVFADRKGQHYSRRIGSKRLQPM